MALGMGQIKTDSVSWTDCMAKYNQLLLIQILIGEAVLYGGPLFPKPIDLKVVVAQDVFEVPTQYQVAKVRYTVSDGFPHSLVGRCSHSWVRNKMPDLQFQRLTSDLRNRPSGRGPR